MISLEARWLRCHSKAISRMLSGGKASVYITEAVRHWSFADQCRATAHWLVPEDKHLASLSSSQGAEMTRSYCKLPPSAPICHLMTIAALFIIFPFNSIHNTLLFVGIVFFFLLFPFSYFNIHLCDCVTTKNCKKIESVSKKYAWYWISHFRLNRIWCNLLFFFLIW